MKVNEILNLNNLNKKYIDNKGDRWEVSKHLGNLVLTLANEGSVKTNIVNIYYLNEILELNFKEATKGASSQEISKKMYHTISLADFGENIKSIFYNNMGPISEYLNIEDVETNCTVSNLIEWLLSHTESQKVGLKGYYFEKDKDYNNKL